MKDGKSINSLRNKYSEFIYDKYRWKIERGNLTAEFSFLIPPNISFRPRIVLNNIPKERLSKIDREVVDNFVFNLGMVEVPSYWKATCSAKIIVNAGTLDSNQTYWWSDLIEKGMGQFFFENEIDFTKKDFFSIKSVHKSNIAEPVRTSGKDVLVPVGGGKDSVVSLELMLRGKLDLGVFLLNPTQASLDIAKIAGVKNIVKVERVVDEKLLELNRKGYLNGHTPFSSVVAFLSVFSAYIFGYKDVALSNERSSDESNTRYLKREINHQYSKTFDFENKFRQYGKHYLSNIEYFSFLRPLYELQISKMFSKMKKYHNAIRSCNVAQKTNSWCGKCSKCLSTYILLNPFLDEEEMKCIFSDNFFYKESLSTILESLILENKVKPFECVGTRQELKLALLFSISKLREKNQGLPLLLEHAAKLLGGVQYSEDDFSKFLSLWNKKNNLPITYEEILRVGL